MVKRGGPASMRRSIALRIALPNYCTLPTWCDTLFVAEPLMLPPHFRMFSVAIFGSRLGQLAL